MRSSISEKLARFRTAGPFLDRNSSETSAHCTGKVLQKNHVLVSAGGVAATLLSLLETNTTQTSDNLLRDVPGQLCSQPMHDIHLGLASSEYVLRDLVPELKYRDKDNYCITRPLTHPKRLRRIFGTIALGARRTFENSFVLLSATSQVPGRLWAAIVLYLFRRDTPDLANSDESASVLYIECTNQFVSLGETHASVCLR